MMRGSRHVLAGFKNTKQSAPWKEGEKQNDHIESKLGVPTQRGINVRTGDD
jgi:hypothetical protein